MSVFYHTERATLHHGDCLSVLKTLPDCSVDAVVTDPPAGIGFMGRSWDSFSVNLPQPDFLNWFAGFVDGEGCFSVHKKPQNTFDCQFSISLRSDDRPILLEIRRTLGIGTVSNPSAHQGGNPQARYCVSSKGDCQRLRAILRAAPLRAKKATDFDIWSEALDAWIGHKVGEWDDMADARMRLMDGRKWTEFGKVAGPPERRAFIAFLKSVMAECLRVLKPGGHALVWAIPRTSHWTATACEDAGFEIRDRVSHLFGSGFPKSMSIGKALDRQAGAIRPVIGKRTDRAATPKLDIRGGRLLGEGRPQIDLSAITGPATEDAAQWEGWGTALKPACEDWWLCRKPLIGTVAANVLEYGTGALHIDECRIPLNGDYKCGANGRPSQTGLGDNYDPEQANEHSPIGRWPANITHDGSDEVVSMFPEQSGGGFPKRRFADKTRNAYGGFEGHECGPGIGATSGNAARFFYCAKASRADRNEGCDELSERPSGMMQDDAYEWPGTNEHSPHRTPPAKNHHPTVKPVALMRWLCRLITPPGGLILDPFSGSASTGKAALLEGFRFLGMEGEEEYCRIGAARLAHAEKTANKPHQKELIA